AVFTQHLDDRFLPVVERAIASALPPTLAPWALTIVHHAWWGVDLFFVVSGFSLALGFLRSARADRQALAPSRWTRAKAFFRRRAARILPAYAVALTVTLAVHFRMLLEPSFPAALAVHALLLQGYLTPGGLVLLNPTWSLTTESHFYLL